MDRTKKKSKSKDGSGQDLRNVGIYQAAATGKTQSEIANEFDLSRQQVNAILNSDEAKRLTDQARGTLQAYLGEAVQTLADAMTNRYEDMRTGVQAATTILKGLGVLTEKAEVTVLKPFILEIDGKEIHMGHKPENE